MFLTSTMIPFAPAFCRSSRATSSSSAVVSPNEERRRNPICPGSISPFAVLIRIRSRRTVNSRSLVQPRRITLKVTSVPGSPFSFPTRSSRLFPLVDSPPTSTTRSSLRSSALSAGPPYTGRSIVSHSSRIETCAPMPPYFISIDSFSLLRSVSLRKPENGSSDFVIPSAAASTSFLRSALSSSTYCFRTKSTISSRRAYFASAFGNCCRSRRSMSCLWRM